MSRPTAAATVCRHCGYPLAESQVKRGDAFCCSGCAAVFELITTEGFADFYRYKPRVTAPPMPRHAPSLTWFDAMPGTSEGGIQSYELDLQGIHCSACTWLLKKLLTRHPGGVDVRVNSALGRARLVWNQDEGDARPFLLDAARFGYRFGPPRRTRTGEDRPLSLRLGLSVALALNAMVFMLPFHLGITADETALSSLFGWLAFLLTSGVVAIGGSLFFASAWRSLRVGVLHFDVPVALGIAFAYAGSVWAFFDRGARFAYFDTVSAFVALMVVGRWVQAHVVSRNRRMLLDETGTESLFTRRLVAGRVESIRATDIEPGDALLVSPGDVVPVEARADAPGHFSLDWITGESQPRRFEAGDRVPAGAFNSGRTPVRVCALGGIDESPLPSLLRETDAGAVDRDAWWERLSRVYVVGVLSVALIAGAGWLAIDPDRAVSVAVAVLVVSCPCAFGIAVPLARELVANEMRRHGVFVRRLDLLDRLTRVRRIMFDKTGTLTDAALAPSPASRERLSRLLPEDGAALRHIAARNNHPICRSLAEVLPPSDTPRGEGGAVVEVAGQGVAWRSAAGVLYRLGRVRFASPAGGVDPSIGTVFSRDGLVLANLDFEESVRLDARAEVAGLRADGYELFVLSGDGAERVANVAAAVGVDADHAHGDLSPEDKASIIATAGRDVFMIGDGVNDTPGFRAALASAAPLSRHGAAAGIADAFYVGEGIRAVGHALAVSKRLRRVTREALGVALVYNAVLVSLAVAGHVTPVIAAVAMPISSIATALFVVRRIRHGSAS